MKNNSTTTLSADAMQELRAKGGDKTDWAKVATSPPADDDDGVIAMDWEKAELVLPSTKQHVNLRLDGDILHFFKQHGKGYQTRINAVLRSYVKAQTEQRK